MHTNRIVKQNMMALLLAVVFAAVCGAGFFFVAVAILCAWGDV